MTTPLRVGVQLPEVEREVPWTEYRAMAVTAEESGFDSVWIGDHLLYRGDGRPERGPWDSWSLLAAVAAVTDRVRLGPLVACTAFHRAGMLAKKAATVNEIAAGRLILGLGAGWNRTEFDAFGIPYDHRVSRFEEAFDIIRRLLEGERVTFDGSYEHVDDLVLLPEPRRPVLMVGSNGDRMLAATLPHVDAWNTWYARYGNTPEGFAEHSAIVDAAAERVGRDPAEIERTASVLVRVDPTSRERPDAPGVAAVTLDGLAQHLRDLAAAGCDEAILILDPITEESIRAASLATS